MSETTRTTTEIRLDLRATASLVLLVAMLRPAKKSVARTVTMKRKYVQ